MSTGLLCIISLTPTQKQTLGLMHWLRTEVARHQHQQPEFPTWNPCDRRKEILKVPFDLHLFTEDCAHANTK